MSIVSLTPPSATAAAQAGFVSIDNYLNTGNPGYLITRRDGTWELAENDYGIDGTWSTVAAAAVPEPQTWALVGRVLRRGEAGQALVEPRAAGGAPLQVVQEAPWPVTYSNAGTTVGTLRRILDSPDLGFAGCASARLA